MATICRYKFPIHAFSKICVTCFGFLQFLGLQVGDDVPNARTIWDIKQVFEKDGREGTGHRFVRFGQLLRSEGRLFKEGSIVDASFVAAPRHRNSLKQNAQIKRG